MKVLDAELDHHPTANRVQEMAELRIRNLQCFAELKALNGKGKLLYQHPLLAQKSERAGLTRLLKHDPSGFLHQYKSASNNLRRYKAYIKAKRPNMIDADREHLKYYTSLCALFKEILADKNE